MVRTEKYYFGETPLSQEQFADLARIRDMNLAGVLGNQAVGGMVANVLMPPEPEPIPFEAGYTLASAYADPQSPIYNPEMSQQLLGNILTGYGIQPPPTPTAVPPRYITPEQLGGFGSLSEVRSGAFGAGPAEPSGQFTLEDIEQAQRIQDAARDIFGGRGIADVVSDYGLRGLTQEDIDRAGMIRGYLGTAPQMQQQTM